MYYRFNENRSYVDSVDDQLVALMTETGEYYTFNETATAIARDLNNGHDISEIAKVLSDISNAGFGKEELSEFVGDLVAKGIMEEADIMPGERPAEMECRKLTYSADNFMPALDVYDDVAAYFMVDPIHEADPQLGWPYAREEEEDK